MYVGSADGMEAGLVQKESDLPFEAISAAAVRGRNPLALAKSIAVMAHGTAEARRLIRRLRPAAILGTGGYVCVPLFLAARSLGIPTVIYLPDVVPGLAVKSLARIATVVACNVEDSATHFGLTIPHFGLTIDDLRLKEAAQDNGASNPKSKIQNRKFIVTGYPVRAELFTQERATCRAAFGLADELPVVFVYGGSRGARSVNQAIAALLPYLLPLAHVIHVCGREGDETFLREAAARLPEELRERYQLYPYLHSEGSAAPGPTMIQALGAADLAVCRSGASTMAELPAAGLPAVLVPYPFVHQEENADYLVARGAAVKVQDAAMLGSGRPEDGPLFQQVRRLLLAHEERFDMSERSRLLARPRAAHHLAELLLALATNTRTEK